MIENELFSLVILKTEFVASKEVTPNNHLHSSTKFIGGENENVCICLFILKSSVSCGFVFVVQLTYQFVSYLEVTILYSFKEAKASCCYVFNEFFVVL